MAAADSAEMGALAVDMKKCETAEFSYGEILCKAGLNKRRELAMTTRKELLDNAAKLFAKMDVREPWLCKAVTGNSVP